MLDKNAPSIAKSLISSSRGETEIIDMLKLYRKRNNLRVNVLGRGVSWLDTGTHSTLHEAASYIEILERRQGLKIACIEEIAFQKGYISKDQLLALAEPMKKNEYGQYLIKASKDHK